MSLIIIKCILNTGCSLIQYYITFHSHYCSHLLLHHLHAYFDGHMYPSPKLVIVQYLFLFLLICSIMENIKLYFVNVCAHA
jgi:hypothetical protein